MLEPLKAIDQGESEALAGAKARTLWQRGDLFHNFSRFPQRPDAPKIDRLSAVLANGLVAPASCNDRSVVSDLRIYAFGSATPYDSVVFLHRLGPESGLYINDTPGKFTVFLDPSIAVLSPEDMGDSWPVMCVDEVYVRDKIPPEQIVGIAVHMSDAQGILSEFHSALRSKAIPLYLNSGELLWPKRNTTTG